MATLQEWTSAADQPRPSGASDTRDSDELPTLPLIVLPHASQSVSQAQALPLPGVFAVVDLAGKHCGDGPLEEVATALRRVPADACLEVRAKDGNVVVALLVWCRLAGHDVIEQSLGRFLVIPASPQPL